jgi:hypothetical protein
MLSKGGMTYRRSSGNVVQTLSTSLVFPHLHQRSYGTLTATVLHIYHALLVFESYLCIACS